MTAANLRRTLVSSFGALVFGLLCITAATGSAAQPTGAATILVA